MNCNRGEGSEKGSIIGCKGINITITKNTDTAGNKRKGGRDDSLGSDSLDIGCEAKKSRVQCEEHLYGYSVSCVCSCSCRSSSGSSCCTGCRLETDQNYALIA